MTEQYIEYLKISALIFFNLFCVLGIILAISAIFAIGYTRKKIGQTNDKVQELLEDVKSSVVEVKDATVNAAGTVAENGFGAMAILTPLLGLFMGRRKRKPKNTFAEILKQFVK